MGVEGYAWALLGRRTIAVTCDRDGHATPAMQQQAADTMDAVFGAR